MEQNRLLNVSPLFRSRGNHHSKINFSGQFHSSETQVSDHASFRSLHHAFSLERPAIGSNTFRNDGSFLRQFQNHHPHQEPLMPMNQPSRPYGADYPPVNPQQHYGPPWFPPNSHPGPPSLFDQCRPPPFPMHPLPPPPPPLPQFNNRK